MSGASSGVGNEETCNSMDPIKKNSRRHTGYWMKATDVHLPVLASTERTPWFEHNYLHILLLLSQFYTTETLGLSP